MRHQPRLRRIALKKAFEEIKKPREFTNIVVEGMRRLLAGLLFNP